MCCHSRSPRLMLEVNEHPTHRKNLCRIVFMIKQNPLYHKQTSIIATMTFPIPLSFMKIYMKTCLMLPTQKDESSCLAKKDVHNHIDSTLCQTTKITERKTGTPKRPNQRGELGDR